MGNCCICDNGLINVNNKDIKLYSLQGKRFNCKIVDIYDGDTCTIVIRNRGELQKYKLRMNGYDSPEMKPPKSNKNRNKEIIEAKKAKKALGDISGHGILILECGGWDKYGRLLGDLYTRTNFGNKNIHINQWMIDNNYGYPYNGGTKKIFK